jgi:predicted transcriptional regulator
MKPDQYAALKILKVLLRRDGRTVVSLKKYAGLRAKEVEKGLKVLIQLGIVKKKYNRLSNNTKKFFFYLTDRAKNEDLIPKPKKKKSTKRRKK